MARRKKIGKPWGNKRNIAKNAKIIKNNIEVLKRLEVK